MNNLPEIDIWSVGVQGCATFTCMWDFPGVTQLSTIYKISLPAIPHETTSYRLQNSRPTVISQKLRDTQYDEPSIQLYKACIKVFFFVYYSNVGYCNEAFNINLAELFKFVTKLSI